MLDKQLTELHYTRSEKKVALLRQSGLLYFESSPFNLPDARFVLSMNDGVNTLDTYNPKTGFMVLYEPNCDGVRSPW